MIWSARIPIKRDKRAILRAVRKHLQYTREQIRRIYAPHVASHHRSLVPSAQYKEVAREEATEATGGTREARLQRALAHKDWSAEDFQRRRVQFEAGACGTAEMGFQHAGTGEMACRLCQSCKASSGEVDGVGLLLGRPTSSADDRLRHRPRLPRPTASLTASGPRGRYGQLSEIRFTSRITPKSTLQNPRCPFF